MNPIKNIDFDTNLLHEKLSQLICPPPDDFDKVLETAKNADNISEFVKRDGYMHPSRFYLIGLLLENWVEKKDYVCTQDELEQFIVNGTEGYGSTILIVYGNLHIKGDLNLMHHLLVLGNLTIDGEYTDCEEVSQLIVFGNMSCTALNTTVWVIVNGNCTVDTYFYGYYNDEVFECLGTVRAKAVVTDEHAIYGGDFDVDILPLHYQTSFDKVLDIRENDDRNLLREAHDEEMEKVISMKLIERFDEDYGDEEYDDESHKY